ncbi:hypothetical protein [Bradyrhizobium sp. 35]|uniref:hypothetical protein n=1 Tax=Bradyrhizobium sp. 35 TaxID=2782670 RepID=UPI001FFA9DE4|nr:hypothetical protein [Bradyrhizobium sp. 35]
MSKRILFGNDPADDPIRERMRKGTEAFLEQFKFKIPMRRRNRLGRGPYWDAYWRSCVTAAAKQLDIEAVQINDQMCVNTQAHAVAIKNRAVELHRAETKTLSKMVDSV